MSSIQERFLNDLTSGVTAFKTMLADYSVLDDPTAYMWASTLAHEIFESFLILDAAQVLRIVTNDAAESLFNNFFSLLWGNFEGSSRKEYVNHSRLSQELIQDFPGFSWVLETRMSGITKHSSKIALRFPELMRQSFAKVMLIQLSLLEQPSVRAYSAAIRNLPGSRWNHLMERRPSPESILQAGEETEILPEAIYHGFFSLLGAISSIGDAIGEGSSREESADATKVLEYVRNAIDWRLNFKSYESGRRIELLRKNILDDSARGLSGYAKLQLRQQLEEILDNVVGLVPA